MKRILIIFNPAARGEKSQRLRQFLESKAGPNVTLAPTQTAGDATRLAAAAGDYDIVVAAGGDGTINEVVNGLNGPALGILPLGTVNVYAKELGIPARLAAAWALLEAGLTRTVDLGCAESAGKQRSFVQLAGVGFDALAVRAASWELKRRFGPLSYVWAGLKALSQPRIPVEVLVDGRPICRPGMAVLIGNGRFYGGTFPLFPEARLDDGRLDVCVFESNRYCDIARYAAAAWRGAHTNLHDVEYFRVESFECRAASPVPFELDGEDAGEVPVKFFVTPRALSVVLPG